MEQRCHLAAVWLTWLGLPLLAVVGLRSVPVLEAAGRLLVGHATSAQISEFLIGRSDVRSGVD